jgi:ABC-type multidrug transport system fused ATPase/permease subunit
LDEATANLDGASEREIMAAVEKLFAERTVIVIAHKLAALPKDARIVVLSQGAISQTGTHAELFRGDGLYRRLYDLQQSQPVDVA